MRILLIKLAIKLTIMNSRVEMLKLYITTKYNFKKDPNKTNVITKNLKSINFYNTGIEFRCNDLKLTAISYIDIFEYLDDNTLLTYFLQTD